MSKFRRMLMMASAVEPVPPTPVLPYDAEVEYLQSSDTQYIDTGLMPNNTFTFDCTVRIVYNNINTIFWGVRNSGTYSSTGQQCYAATNLTSQTARVRRIRLWTTTTTSDANWDSGIVPSLGTFYTLTNMTCVSAMAQFSRTIKLFGFDNIGSMVLSSSMIASFTAYENGTKVMDMIPVRVGNTGYMYDKVSGQLFGNAGSGSFVLGADV